MLCARRGRPEHTGPDNAEVARMSAEANSRPLNLTPVLADRDGQPSITCKFVIIGLANRPGPDGTGPFPSVATLVAAGSLDGRPQDAPGPQHRR